MRSLLTGLFAALLALAPAASPRAAEGAPGPAPAPALWRIDTGGAPIWLFGSFHMLRPGSEWRTGAVDAAFAAADVAVFETATDGAAMAEIQKEVLARGLLLGGERLSDRLGPEEFATVSAYAQSVGLPVALIEQMRPWYVALSLSVQAMVAQGFNPAEGVETELVAEARAAGKTFAYLETAAEQIEVFAGLDPEHEKTFLLKTIEEIQSDMEQAVRLEEAWLTGDTATLSAMINDVLAEDAVLYERLLVARNRNWVAAIEGYMADPRSYILVVGAGHLVGADSVVALLRAKGIPVDGP